MRNIERIMAPGIPHFVGDGFRVHNFIPGGQKHFQKRMDPFILMDYNSKYTFPPSVHSRGVGAHPHRGFETVTIAYKGAVAHQDSAGNEGVIREGDVQWMTAGSGILHKEYHAAEFSATGGEFQMVQLWVNLPSRFKGTPPRYQGIVNRDIHRYPLENEGGEIEVIAGDYKGITGTASTFTPVHLMNARLKENARADFSFPAHYNTALIVIEGEIEINDGIEVAADHFVLFQNEGEEFSIRARKEAVVLVLSGEPFNEPIVQQGPFVMNTQDEIQQAVRDFNLGRYGSFGKE